MEEEVEAAEQPFDFQKELASQAFDFESFDDIAAPEIDDLEGVEDDLLLFQQDDVVKEALERGVNLGMYAKQIERELEVVEANSIEDYIASSEQLFSLHEEIVTCDNILQNMQSMLSGFQNHLKSISGEIKELQEKSSTLNIQLTNRKGVEKEVSRFVDGLVVSPELISAICEAPINKDYIDHLTNLNSKLQFASSLPPSSSILDDVIPVLDNLKKSAISRVRSFMIKKIQDLKVRQTNIQIKQDHILEFKYLSTFLADHAPDVATEIRQIYMDTMTKVYGGLFRDYLNNMHKLRTSKSPDKGDVIGHDGSKGGGFFSNSRNNAELNRLFAIGERFKILEPGMADAQIVPHVALKSPERYHYEIIYKSATKLLKDTATSEYFFVKRFFNDNTLFNNVFQKPLQLFSEKLDDYVNVCYDCYCLIIMIRILQQQKNEMNHRTLKCLNTFFNGMNMKLWPRFKKVFDDNFDSIRSYKISQEDKKKLVESPSAIHFATIRYANFINGLLLLCRPIGDDVLNNRLMITSNLERLREEMEKLLMRLASNIPQAKMQSVFLINNYDVIVSVLRKNQLVESAEYQRYRTQAEEQKTRFVEEMLQIHFKSLIECVTQVERRLEADPGANVDEGWLVETGADFKANWKSELHKIDQYIKNHFTPNIPADMAAECGDLLRNQQEILKQVFVQLLLYYKRFESTTDTAKKATNRSFRVEMVSVQTIRFEMRKLVEGRAR